MTITLDGRAQQEIFPKLKEISRAGRHKLLEADVHTLAYILQFAELRIPLIQLLTFQPPEGMADAPLAEKVRQSIENALQLYMQNPTEMGLIALMKVIVDQTKAVMNYDRQFSQDFTMILSNKDILIPEDSVVNLRELALIFRMITSLATIDSYKSVAKKFLGLEQSTPQA